MPANTSRGFPYPLPTEPVAEGAQAIRNLAEAVDTKAGLHLIQAITLGATGQFDFQNIPQTFTHLKAVLSVRSAAVANIDTGILRINAIATASYSSEWLFGDVATPTAGEVVNQDVGHVAFCVGNNLGNSCVYDRGDVPRLPSGRV